MDRIDVADLDQGLRRYLGDDGPFRSADYVTGSATVRIDLGDVRPRATAEVPPFVLLVNEAPGSVLRCTWRVTSTGFDGIQDGDLDIEVAEEPVDPGDVLPPTEDVGD